MSTPSLLTVLQPGHDAALFRKIAETSEHSLLEFLFTLAVRKDGVSMNGFLDFAEETAREGCPLKMLQVARKPSYVPAHAGDAQTRLSNEPVSYLGACIQYVANHNGDPMNADQMRFLHRAAKWARSQPSGERRVTLLLQMAVGQVKDPRAATALIAAGADSAATFRSLLGDVGAVDVGCIEEAMRAGNFLVAQELLARSTQQSALLLLISIETLADREAHDIVDAYCSHPIVVPLLEKLFDGKEASLAEVRGLLFAIDGAASRQHQIDLAVGDSEREFSDAHVADRFRFALLGAYLRRCTVRGVAWEPSSIRMLAGGFADDHTPLVEFLSSYAARIAASEQPPAGKALVPRVVREALATHCHPALELAGAFIEAAARFPNGCGISHGYAVRSSRVEGVIKAQNHLDETNFIQTIKALTTRGHDLARMAELSAGVQAPAIHSCAILPLPDMQAKLPILLALGADPDAKNGEGWTALDTIREPEKKQQWTSIVKSYRLRQSATRLIEEFDIAGPKALQP
ncbi:hypothetical protein ACSFA0_25045 [Variovorax sp. LT1P1]|uniref:hypothetical protein n=1 Tax=Variovorax sp. LT1P1 TaxID=3443730 RepID=UPI003F471927